MHTPSREPVRPDTTSGDDQSSASRYSSVELDGPPANSAIMADLEFGEPPILLTDLRNEPFMPRKAGKKLDKSVPFRWASRGTQGVRLESITTPTGKATTRSAVLRFFAALSRHNTSTVPTSTPRVRRAAVQRAHAELEAAGI